MIYVESNGPYQGVFAKVGVDVPNLTTIRGNMKQGAMLGFLTIVPVAFASFCLYYTSIPLYLAFRRCAIVTTVIFQFVWTGVRPSRGVLISIALILIGASIAVSENFEANLIGLLCIWGYNISSSFQRVYLSAVNKEKSVTAFESNFYYACIGFVSTVFYNFILTDNYTPLLKHCHDTNFQALVLM